MIYIIFKDMLLLIKVNEVLFMLDILDIRSNYVYLDFF